MTELDRDVQSREPSGSASLLVHQDLPTFPVPRKASRLAADPRLRIEGLVAQECVITRAHLAQLTRASFTEDFQCEQHWTTPQQKWTGPRLIDVLNLVGLLPSAAYVRVHAGNYVVPISLLEAEQALLADTLNDQPLAVEHGAPWRLALAGSACFTSVKWVERLELVAEPGENVGERVAQKRSQIQTAQAAASVSSDEM